MARRGEAKVAAGSGNVERALRCVARCVLERRLTAGDLLPTQRELSRELKMGNDTLTAAMSRLVEAGAVSRRVKRGTVLEAPEKLPSPEWHVGVVMLTGGTSGARAFDALLAYRMQHHLAARGCRVRSYPRVRVTRQPAKPEDFAGLTADLEAEPAELDGLIALGVFNAKAWRVIEQQGVRVTAAGYWYNAPAGVTIDFAQLVRDASGALRETGTQRIAVVANPESTRRASVTEAPQRVVAEAGCETLYGEADEDDPTAQGASAARRWLALPPEERPDGLVVCDDWSALGLTSVLAEQTDDPPAVACLTNRELPMQFALPVIRFELSIDALAACAVDALVDVLELRADPGTLHRFPFELVQSPPHNGPANTVHPRLMAMSQ